MSPDDARFLRGLAIGCVLGGAMWAVIIMAALALT